VLCSPELALAAAPDPPTRGTFRLELRIPVVPAPRVGSTERVPVAPVVPYRPVFPRPRPSLDPPPPELCGRGLPGAITPGIPAGGGCPISSSGIPSGSAPIARRGRDSARFHDGRAFVCDAAWFRSSSTFPAWSAPRKVSSHRSAQTRHVRIQPEVISLIVKCAGRASGIFGTVRRLTRRPLRREPERDGARAPRDAARNERRTSRNERAGNHW
jgi:hypothetical protein